MANTSKTKDKVENPEAPQHRPRPLLLRQALRWRQRQAASGFLCFGPKILESLNIYFWLGRLSPNRMNSGRASRLLAASAP